MLLSSEMSLSTFVWQNNLNNTRHSQRPLPTANQKTMNSCILVTKKNQWNKISNITTCPSSKRVFSPISLMKVTMSFLHFDIAWSIALHVGVACHECFFGKSHREMGTGTSCPSSTTVFLHFAIGLVRTHFHVGSTVNTMQTVFFASLTNHVFNAAIPTQ